MTPDAPLDWRAFAGMAVGVAGLIACLLEYRDHWRMPR